MPTLAQRQGILSVAVRNPLTGVTYAAGTPIPLTAFAQKVLNDLPAPNLTGVAGANYQELVLNRNFSDKYNVRIDHKFNDTFSIFGRWSYRKLNAFEAPNIPGASGSNQNGFVNALNKQLTLGATYVLRNASVFDVRYAFSKIDAGKRPPLIGGASVQELYGITGLPNDPTINGGLTTQTITGLSQLGRQATNPQFQNPVNNDLRLSYAFLLGKHSLKVGYEYLAVNTAIQDTNPLLGLDTYSGQFTRPIAIPATPTTPAVPAPPASNQYNLADFYFGLRSQYELANLTVAQMRQRFHFGYIQDDYKVNRKLTLNLGLRYEFGTPYYEKDNKLSNYDPVSNSIVLAKNGSLSDRSLVNPDYNNFGPRLGFAYNIFDKTVIRGGYGIGYVFLNRLGSANILGTNFPIITRAAVAQIAPDPTNNPLCVGATYAANCFRTTQAGYPTSGLPNNVTLYVPKDTPTSSIQNYQISIQRELPLNFVIDVAYVGNRAKNLVLLADYNQARPLTAAEAATAPSLQPSLQARRPIQGFGSISAVIPEGFSQYNALQIKLERRFSQGLYVLNSFTYSKALDNGSQVLEEPNGNTGTPQNFYNIAADKGIGAYDQPFNNTTSFVYELPVGRGRLLGKNLNPIIDGIIGGWSLTGINTATSGQPINLRVSNSSPVTNNLPTFLGGVALRPNIICDPTNRDTRPNPTAGYFNTACFAPFSATAPFGNAGRNIARSNRYFNFDLSVQKQFRLPFNEETRLEIRAEFFNLFNRTNFAAANGTFGNAAFGTITSTFPARQIQVAAKFYF